MKRPPLVALRQENTHRLVPRKFALEEDPLLRLGDTAAELRRLSELERATDNRALGEAGLLPGISIHELVFGVPYARVLNAAFTYARLQGGRFNSPDRGAWYAAFHLETSKAEVAYHRGQDLREIKWPHAETFEYVEFLADFRGEFHDIRWRTEFRSCLALDTYLHSQRLGKSLLRSGSAGIVFPSVRDKRHGDCIVCFRPALVTNIRRGTSVTVRFDSFEAAPAFIVHGAKRGQ